MVRMRTEAISKHPDITDKPRDFTKPFHGLELSAIESWLPKGHARTYRSRFNERCGDTAHGYDKNGDGVIVVFVK